MYKISNIKKNSYTYITKREFHHSFKLLSDIINNIVDESMKLTKRIVTYPEIKDLLKNVKKIENDFYFWGGEQVCFIFISPKTLLEGKKKNLIQNFIFFL